MLRYLLLSTVIVIGTAVVVTAWVNRDLIRIKIAAVYARVPAKAGASSAAGRAPERGACAATRRGRSRRFRSA